MKLCVFAHTQRVKASPCGCVTYSVEVGDGLKGGPFLLFLGSPGSLLLFEEQSQQRQGGLLEESHHRLIQGVFVLLQPASDVVAHLGEAQAA